MADACAGDYKSLIHVGISNITQKCSKCDELKDLDEFGVFWFQSIGSYKCALLPMCLECSPNKIKDSFTCGLCRKSYPVAEDEPINGKIGGYCLICRTTYRHRIIFQ